MNALETNNKKYSNYHAEAIEEDISTTRDRMESTWQKLSEKTEPSELFAGLHHWMKDKLEGIDSTEATETLRDAGSRAGQIIRENPVPIALGVAAIGSTLLPTSSDRSGGSLNVSDEGSLDRLKAKGQELWKSGENKVADATERAHAVAQEQAEAAKKIAGNALERTSEAGHAMADKVTGKGSQSKEQIADKAQSNPISLCAGALVSGMVIGLLLPKSRREGQLYGKVADEVRTRAGEAYRSTVKDTREKLAENRLNREGLEERTQDAINRSASKVEEKLDEAGLNS